ncbi:MCP four helix bundle domain-containing protein, partial [Caballeronia mineralivorans]|uniref:MCP four helix bundle domain-containing protein n=1 Tax=Caballeronia mineralivorans TaxID=2010198 RepID=UPI002AFE123F
MKQLTIRNRILASFGVILALMLVMAVCSYILLGAIDRDARSQEEDSSPGVYLATTIRAAWFENYTVTQRLIFIDSAPDQVQRDTQRIAETRESLDKLIDQYAATVFEDTDRRLFTDFKQQRSLYAPVQAQIMADLPASKEAAAAVFNTQLTPVWETGRTVVRALVEHNNDQQTASSQSIRESVKKAEIALPVIVLVTILVAAWAGLLLLRAITVPMERLVEVVDAMRTGDLSQRLHLERGDEFGALGAGFNRMTDELTGLVGQAQKSAV